MDEVVTTGTIEVFLSENGFLSSFLPTAIQVLLVLLFILFQATSIYLPLSQHDPPHLLPLDYTENVYEQNFVWVCDRL